MNKFVTFLVSMAKVLVKPFFPMKIYGCADLPQKKTLLVGNHISGWDPVVYTMWSKNRISFVYKAEFRKVAFLRWVFDGMDFVPVKRGEVDLFATKSILKLLKEDKIVGLFPEGTRNPEVDCLQEKTKVLRKNYLIVGEEFTLEEFYDRPVTKEMLLEATEKVRNQVDLLRVKLNGILAEKGVKRRKRTRRETEKINKYNRKQKTLAKERAKQQSEKK